MDFLFFSSFFNKSINIVSFFRLNRNTFDSFISFLDFKQRINLIATCNNYMTQSHGNVFYEVYVLITSGKIHYPLQYYNYKYISLYTWLALTTYPWVKRRMPYEFELSCHPLRLRAAEKKVRNALKEYSGRILIIS